MLSSYIALSTKVDWENNGNFTGTYDDVSADGRYPLSTSRGRAGVTDDFRTGQGSFRLRNPEGDYTPFNASSPIYPNVVPGRPVQVQATYNAVTYPVFKGRCSPSGGRWASDGEIEFAMLDGFEDLRLGLTRTALQETKRTDELITVVLDDIGWPAGDRDLDTGVQTLATFTNHNRLPLNALLLIAKQELGGSLFMSREGKVVFRNRNYRSLRPVYATLAGTFESLVPEMRQEDLVDEVRASYGRFVVATAVTAVYTMSGSGRRLDAGSTAARNTFEGAFNGAGAKNAITPVATTDYTANSAADGSGTDKTAQVAVAAFTATSGGFSITFDNLDSSPVYLTAFQVRGYAVTAGSEDNVITVAVSGALVSGQTLSQAFEFNDDVGAVNGWATFQAAARGGAWQPRLTLVIRPDTDALMAVVLGAELGYRVTVTDTGAPWLTQVSGDWFIEAINMEFNGPAEVTATWTLFSRDLAGGSFFRISGPAGAGQDYSTIAPAAATVGYDRIAW